MAKKSLHVSPINDLSGSIQSGLTVSVTVKKLKGKAKTEADNAAFFELVDDGIAPINYSVPSQDTSRKNTLAKFDARIEALHRAQECLKNLPMGVMLYVRASSRIYEAPAGLRWGTRQIDLVITPISINLDSVRCILWSQEYTSWETEQISKGRKTSLRPIKFTDIYSFRPWVPDDAALTVNHRYQSPAYKRLAYSV